MPLWLTRSDVQKLLTMPAAIDAVAEAFRLLHTGQAELPLRTNMPVPALTPAAGAPPATGGSLLAMPAFVGGTVQGLGVKLITLFGANPNRYSLPAIQGNFALFDAQNGQLLAVMEASHLTAVRTGAAGGVAARHLARQDAHTLAIFGSGAQAPAQVEAVLCERPIRRVLVLSRALANARKFAQRLAQRFDLQAEATDDPAWAVQQADVIVTATSAHSPLFDGALLPPGVHISGIGSHLPDAREVDARTVQRAKVVTDQTSACLAEAGDLIQPIAAGQFAPEQIHAQIGAVVAGEKPGRTAPDEITFFKSVGLAVQDVAVARLVYAEAVAQGVGQRLEE